MPRPKFRAPTKNGNRGRKNFKGGKPFDKSTKGGNRFDKHGGNKRKATSEVDVVGRKYKFIRRNQESEEASRRQMDLERSFQEKHRTADENRLINDNVESSSEEEADPMGELLSTLAAGGQNVKKKTNEAIESSESEDSDESNDLDGEDSAGDSDDDDDIFPEKFEEQSQPRGRKYHSSEEEGEESEEEGDAAVDSDSSDDLPEDTVLRPEESKHRKTFDDTIASDEEELDAIEEGGDVEDELESADENATDEEPDEKGAIEKDIFARHLDHELSPELLECVNTTPYSKTQYFNWPVLGRIQVDLPTVHKEEEAGGSSTSKKKVTLLDDDTVYAAEGSVPTLISNKIIDLNALDIKVQMHPHIAAANKKNMKDDDKIFTDLQLEVFSVVNNYQDIYYPQRNHQNGEEIRFVYCLHAVNHILKTRAKVLNHNSKLGKMAAADPKSTIIVPDAYRDQGLFRTKVLIIAPFRESAVRIVNNFIDLLYPQAREGGSGGAQIMHYKRFLDEFGGDSLHFPKKNPKPEDYELTFAGNSDDTFRIGIAFTRKCMRLYTDFYSSDVLIVSPLGLRMIVGAPGDKERDYDFLASIEMLILDQADVFMAQNWDHVLHVLDHMHLQPQSARNTDFSRVRSWCLNGWSRFYRQTLLLTSYDLPEFRSLFNTRLSNYRGKVRVANPIVGGSIKHVAVPIAQVFHRIEVSSIQSSFDQRFEHFINVILPQFKPASMGHCLVFIPSYFDFVRIRNYFKRETLNFVQICEYTKVSWKQ